MAIGLVYATGRKQLWQKKRCIQILTIILTCFSGFRSWRMGDVFHYCNAYLVCNLPDWKLDIDSGDTIGLQLFLRTFGQMGFSFEVCIFVIAAFVAISLAIFVYRYSPSPFWSYVMYLCMGFYIFSFSALKQTIAMSFVIWAAIAIFQSKPHKFLFWVALASLFHPPALLFLIAYPFAHKRVDALYFLIFAIAMVLIFIYRDSIVHFASDLYYEEDMEFTATDTLGGKAIVMVGILLCAVILRPLKNYDVLYRKVFSLIVLATMIQTFSVYDNVFTRLADYFFQFIVLLIPLMIQPAYEQAKDYPNDINSIRYWPPKVLFLVQLVLVAFSLYFYFSTINGSSALLDAFQFVWEVDEPSSLELLNERLAAFGGY